MKRVISLVLVAIMAFSCMILASCSNEESSVASESASSVASEATSEASSEATSSEEASEATSEETTEEVSEEASAEIPEDVKATASYKYFEAIDFTQGVTVKSTVDLMGMAVINMTICAMGEEVYMYTESTAEGVTAVGKIYVKDGKTYTFDETNKTYFVVDGVEGIETIEDYKVENMFEGVSLVSTTTEEIEGVTYTVDTFATADDMESKYYLDAEGNVKMISEMGMVMPFEFTAGVIEGCFELPNLDEYTSEAVEEDETEEGDVEVSDVEESVAE